MLNRLGIKRNLAEPYPYYWQGKGLAKMLCLITVASFIFSYAFQPFVIYIPEHKMDFIWICAIHAMVPFIVGYAFFPIINRLGVEEKKWTVGKEFGVVTVFLFLVGIGSFLVRDIIYDNPRNWSFRYLYEEIRNTFFVGILLALVLVPLHFNRLRRKYEYSAALVDTGAAKDTKSVVAPKDNLIFIKTQVKNDDFHLAVNHILFVKAAGNYVEIFMESGERNEPLLKRISIKDLEVQLAAFGYIVRTHRAYLVNRHRITGVKGNAQGYRLAFDGIAEAVPVSRSMIAVFNAAMKG